MTWTLKGYVEAAPAPKFNVVAYDFGIKRNILRMLAARGCKVTVVPAQTSAADVLKYTSRTASSLSKRPR